MKTKYTEELMSLLDSVNSEINSYPYKTDSTIDVINLEDLRKVKHGVCSDYAYTKMICLKEKGVNDASMAICTCYVAVGSQIGGYHAVLLVSTDAGDFILDNRFFNVMGFEEASMQYNWDSIPDYVKGSN